MATQHFFLLVLLFSSSTLFSQHKEGFELTGNVFSNGAKIALVHIVNKASLHGTTTNSNGHFRLFVKVGDTLAISHMSFEHRYVAISEMEKTTKQIDIQLTIKTHTLNEITIKKKRSIFYVDPQIMPKAIAYAPDLKLPYSNGVKTRNNPMAKINLTSAALNLNHVLDFFNGNTQKKRELQRETLKDERLAAIRKTYSDSFFVHQLKIEKKYINLFLNYCLHASILKIFKKGNRLELTAALLSQSKSFPHRESNLQILLSQQ